MESKALKTAIEKAVKETTYQLKGMSNNKEKHKIEEILTEGGNTIINTKEFLKLKEEYREMLELLKDIHDMHESGEYPSEYDYDDIKELLDKILLNE